MLGEKSFKNERERRCLLFYELETRVEVRTGPTPPVFSHLAWPLPTDFVAPPHQESFAWGSSRQVAAAHPKAEI